ncbi:MAG: hypothetical protein LBR40_02565 [Bacilli bacterium]|jgi:hypothetical protein|nr:hypothetical protein [Bacilli bacterium]
MNIANVLRIIAVIELTILLIIDLAFNLNKTLVYIGVGIGLLLIIIGNVLSKIKK